MMEMTLNLATVPGNLPPDVDALEPITPTQTLLHSADSTPSIISLKLTMDLDVRHFQARSRFYALPQAVPEPFLWCGSTQCDAGGPVSSECAVAMQGVLGLYGCLEWMA